MYSIPDLETFVAVARCGGVTSAAREQGISAATVSHRLGKLEAALSMKLFNRDSRSVSLSEEGQVFFSRIEVILEDLRQAEYAASGNQSQLRGHLKVTMSPWILSRFIFPRLAKFRQQHPELTVEFLAVDRFVSLAEEAQDCAIRVGRLPDSALKFKKLCDNERIICATPHYLREHGHPKNLHELREAQWVCLPWQTRFDVAEQGAKLQELKVRRHLLVSSSDMLSAAANNGLGLVARSRLAVQHELDTGQLLEVMPGTLRNAEAPISFVYAPHTNTSLKTKAFAQLAQDAFIQYPH